MKTKVWMFFVPYFALLMSCCNRYPLPNLFFALPSEHCCFAKVRVLSGMAWLQQGISCLAPCFFKRTDINKSANISSEFMVMWAFAVN